MPLIIHYVPRHREQMSHAMLCGSRGLCLKALGDSGALGNAGLTFLRGLFALMKMAGCFNKLTKAGASERLDEPRGRLR